MSAVTARSALTSAFCLGLLCVLLSGCGLGGVARTPSQEAGDTRPQYGDEQSRDTIFGPGGLFGAITGNHKNEPNGGGIGVNSFLWRASLDTISFMPVTSADPFGGVIITDWYAPKPTDAERFKLNIYILGRQLRADGVRVAVFRQTRDKAGNWADAPVTAKTATDLENAILTRARELRKESEAHQQ